jgi:hypothetical protein
MDPLPSRASHRIADSIDTDGVIMIAANGEHRCNVAELADELAQAGQFGCAIHEIATQEYGICFASRGAIKHLLAQHVGTTAPQMNIADVHQPTRIVPCGNAFFADVKRVSKPKFQHAWGSSPSAAIHHGTWTNRVESSLGGTAVREKAIE